MAGDDLLPAATVLPGPGSGAGSGPVVEPLLDGLLSDLVPAVPVLEGAPVEGRAEAAALAVAEHREHRAAWYGDLIGPLRVPASATPSVLAALRPGDHAMPVVLTPDPVSADLLGGLRAARSLLLDNHRVELAGVELPFAAADSAADAARLALDALDFTVPAWFMVRAEPGWEPAFDVLAQDGAESVALYLPAPGPAGPAGTARPGWPDGRDGVDRTDGRDGVDGRDAVDGRDEVDRPDGRDGDGVDAVAGVLRALIDRELPFAVTDGVTGLVTGGGGGGAPSGYGVLNLLVASRAALDGTGVPALAAILRDADRAGLAAEVRRMSEADAAIVRAFLSTVGCPSIREMVEELAGAGLIEPDAA